MQATIQSHLEKIIFDPADWFFSDVRIDIPALSFGSDAINRHTQYSNPVALYRNNGQEAVGASFTLGYGNKMICEAAEYMVQQLNGCSVADLIDGPGGFYEALTNPKQLRWLSPMAGVPLMAGGLIVNTILDAASKSAGMPAWEYLARLPTDFLLSILNFRHVDPIVPKEDLRETLDSGLSGIDDRCELISGGGLPVYFTTWIGHSANEVIDQIHRQNDERGFTRFKLKIGPDFLSERPRIEKIIAGCPAGTSIFVDANQTLTYQEASSWMVELSDLGVGWLEEPFSPDNVELFARLVKEKRERALTTEIVTGENCPNYHVASALMASGIDRFQADPCRMLGMLDAAAVSLIAKHHNCEITPHAGGSSLDEQSPHIQLFNLARVKIDQSPLSSLTENVGFCAKYFQHPTRVSRGLADAATAPGLLVGLAPEIQDTLKPHQEGVTWLEL